MSEYSGKDLFESDDTRPCEGLFDAQLSLPIPFVEAPQPLTSIIKRDGRTVAFEKRKIAGAILKAAQSVGMADMDQADSLASGVALYLSKKQNGAPPTVDQVNDAVERVLIELGHPRTALAYARFRDKRARIRLLRDGDIRGFLVEFEEAQRERGEGPKPGDLSLFVRTGDERLDSWDRTKIVEALTRETEIDASTATIIAIEVERQILDAKVKAPSASLIRELVDTKLIEHGLEEFRQRHMRLGVPLYDAEQIVCMPNQQVGRALRDPASTDMLLAERIKKEFALSQVFSRDVVTAHLSGDIHIRGLGQIDRFIHTVESPELLSRFGIRTGSGARTNHPPMDARTFCSQLAVYTGLLHRHYSGTVGWSMLNVFAAPFLSNGSTRTIQDFADDLVTSLSRSSDAETELELSWVIPDQIAVRPAVGPCSPTAYGQLEGQAQKLGWAILEAFRDLDMVSDLKLVVDCSQRFFLGDEHRAILDLVAEVVLHRGGVVLSFDRASGETTADDVEHPLWPSLLTVPNEVAVNLPRCAYRSGSVQGLVDSVRHAIRIAVVAHVQKAAFLDRLLTWKDMGPLSLLSQDLDDHPYVNMHQATYRVGLLGLNECVRAVLGSELHQTNEALALGGEIARHAALMCAELGEEHGLRIELSEIDDETVSRRLLMLDLQEYGELARRLLRTAQVESDLAYTAGVRLAPTRDVSPMERLRLEGSLHQYINNACSRVVLPDADLSREAIVDFIRSAFHRTDCRRFAFAY